LRNLRKAFDIVRYEGLESNICKEGDEPEYYIINNGGLPTLVVTTGSKTEHAPDRLECWSDAASELHGFLESVFDRYRDEKSE